MTVFRSALRRYDTNGVTLTIITSNEESRIIEKGLGLKNGFIVNIGDYIELADSGDLEEIEIGEIESIQPAQETEFEKDTTDYPWSFRITPPDQTIGAPGH